MNLNIENIKIGDIFQNKSTFDTTSRENTPVFKVRIKSINKADKMVEYQYVQANFAHYTYWRTLNYFNEYFEKSS